jgi:hypothetical protein
MTNTPGSSKKRNGKGEGILQKKNNKFLPQYPDMFSDGGYERCCYITVDTKTPAS